MPAMDIRIGNFLRLDVSMQVLLSIFEAHGQIGRSPGAPEEMEIIAEALMLIELSHGAEEAILPLRGNRCVLAGGGRLGRSDIARFRRIFGNFLPYSGSFFAHQK